MKRINTGIIVLGGGPSGANAARYLAKGNKDVVLIEKDFAFKKPCGGGLFLHAFDEFDIPKSLIKKEVNSIEIVSPDIQKSTVDITDFPLGIVHRQEFDAALRALAQDAGATLIEAKMYNIESANSAVTVKAHQTDGTDLEVHAQYLVAADGVNSPTRRHMLGETPNRILTHYADLEEDETEVCQFWFGEDISPGYYAWIFPHHQGVNIGLVAKDKRRIRQFYQRFFQKALIPGSVPKPRGYFIPHWKPMRLYKDRIFYVGDSASLVLPFTYEGIYYALKSGKIAAEAILKNNPSLYEKNWNDLYLRRFKFLRLLQSIFLRNDWFSAKMSRLCQHKKIQRAFLGYWSGRRNPEGAFATIIKVFKVLIFYR